MRELLNFARIEARSSDIRLHVTVKAGKVTTVVALIDTRSTVTAISLHLSSRLAARLRTGPTNGVKIIAVNGQALKLRAEVCHYVLAELKQVTWECSVIQNLRHDMTKGS